MKHKLQFRRCVAMLMLLAVSALSWAYDYEVNADMVISEVYTGLPVNFSTIYDCDGDGEMDYLCYKNVSGSKSVFGFYNKKGELLRELPNNSGSSSTLPVATPINGEGDLVSYISGSAKVVGENVALSLVRMIADIDNDGRMDLVMAPDSKSFTIYYQQADGTFLPVEQSVTEDAAEAEAAAKRKGSSGVVSFTVGMMVKARETVPNPDEDEANARSAVGENVPVGATRASTTSSPHPVVAYGTATMTTNGSSTARRAVSIPVTSMETASWTISATTVAPSPCRHAHPAARLKRSRFLQTAKLSRFIIRILTTMATLT